MPLTQFLPGKQPYPDILKDVLQPKEMPPSTTVNLFKLSEVILGFKTWHVRVALTWFLQEFESTETTRHTQVSGWTSDASVRRGSAAKNEARAQLPF